MYTNVSSIRRFFLSFSLPVLLIGSIVGGAPRAFAQNAPPKQPMHGLVSMGSRAFDLTQGGIPDNDMEEINAHPGIYSGAVINLTWLQLEPSQNVFDDSALDSAIANINAYNSKYPATPVTAKIRVSAGTGTPPWVWNLTGGPITVASSACAGLTCVSNASPTMQIGAFWQPAYISAWRALQTHLASEYDSNPLIQEVAITSCSSKTAEPFVVDTDFTSLVNMRAFGYSDAAYQDCLLGAQQDYAPWVNTPLDFTFFPFISTDPCTTSANACEKSDPDFTIQVMDIFRSSLGTTRGVVANQGLEDPLSSEFNGVLLPLYAAFQTLYQQAQKQNPPSASPLEFQTSAANVDWDGAVQVGLMYHPTEIEVWDTTAANGPAPIGTTQLQTYSGLLSGTVTAPQAGPHLVSAASLKTTAASESLVSIFGAGMAANSNTTVTITDSAGTAQQAQTIYVSPSQINAVLPGGVADGATIITVSPPGLTAITGAFVVSSVAPGIFTANEGGSGTAAAEVLTVGANGNSTSTYSFTCASSGSCTSTPFTVNPSEATVYLVLYGTGFRNRSALANTSVTIGDQTVTPTYAGAQNQFSGLDQINVPIPASMAHAGLVNVTFTADNVPSNTVTVQIQ